MKKGISLVALIITIIVLIILTATVVLTGMGTPQEAQLAVFYNNISTVQEAVRLEMNSNLTKYASRGTTNLMKYKWVGVVEGYTEENAQEGISPVFNDTVIQGNNVEKINLNIKKNLTMSDEEFNKYYVDNNGVVYYEGFAYEGITYYNKTVTTAEPVTPPTRPTVETDIYVVLTNDGELVFSNNEADLRPYRENELKYYGNIKDFDFKTLNDIYHIDLNTLNIELLIEEGEVVSFTPWFQLGNNISEEDLIVDDILSVTFLNEIIINSEKCALFMSCIKLEEINNISYLNVSNVKDFTGMFLGCMLLNELNISGWDTSNATNMSYMFADCESLDSLNIGEWNTSNVRSMLLTFAYCSSLISLDINEWNTTNVRDMSGMFGYCSNLTELDLSKWNTSNVTNTIEMFEGSTSLTELNLSGWNTNTITNAVNMFNTIPTTTEIIVGPNWNLAEESTNFDGVFIDAE